MATDKAPQKSESEKTSKDENPKLAKGDPVQFRQGRAKETKDK
jgi:hypothetical protein